MIRKLISLLVALLLLAGAASAQSWTLTEIEVPEGEPIGISPDGSTMLLRDENGLMVLRDGELKRLVPNYERGVEDTYGNFEKMVSRLEKGSIYVILDSVGAIWSPDGRYFTLAYYWMIHRNAKFFSDLVLFDIEKGEFFLADTDGNNVREGFSTVESACFDESGKNLYFVRFGNHTESRETLERYDLKSGKITRLAELSSYSYPRAGLCRLNGNRYLRLCESDKEGEGGALILCEEKWSFFNGKQWEEKNYPFSAPYSTIRTHKLLSQPGAKYALVCARAPLQAEEGSSRSFGLLFRANVEKEMEGIDECIYIDSPEAEQASTFTVSEKSDEELVARFEKLYSDGVSIENAALSPDGKHAILKLHNWQRGGYYFAVLDMETLALSRIPADGFSLGYFDDGIDNYTLAPGMQWVTDDRVLIYDGSKNRVRLFEIEHSAG